MPEKKDEERLSFVFSVKEGSEVIFFPVARGENIGYAKRARKHMLPGLVFSVKTNGKPGLLRQPSVMFASPTLMSHIKLLETVFGDYEAVSKALAERKLVLSIRRFGRIYSVMAVPIESWLKRFFPNSPALTEEKLNKLFWDENKLKLFDDFDGKRLAKWYDDYSVEKGWLEPAPEDEKKEEDIVSAEETTETDDLDWI